MTFAGWYSPGWRGTERVNERIAGEPPPEFGWPFVAWLRLATERAWGSLEERTLADFERAGVGGLQWRRGTRWTGGLSATEIDEVERRFGLQFPPDYRLFLSGLHSTAPRCRGGAFIEGRRMREVSGPGFFDWLRDDEELRDALARPLEGLLFDVQNGLWRSAWGSRPDDAMARERRVRELVASAPKLIPVIGHRYVVEGGTRTVLSVHQSDIIVYGKDLRTFLLNELHGLLGLEPDPSWMNGDARDIPLWGELVD